MPSFNPRSYFSRSAKSDSVREGLPDWVNRPAVPGAFSPDEDDTDATGPEDSARFQTDDSSGFDRGRASTASGEKIRRRAKTPFRSRRLRLSSSSDSSESTPARDQSPIPSISDHKPSGHSSWREWLQAPGQFLHRSSRVVETAPDDPNPTSPSGRSERKRLSRPRPQTRCTSHHWNLSSCIKTISRDCKSRWQQWTSRGHAKSSTRHTSGKVEQWLKNVDTEARSPHQPVVGTSTGPNGVSDSSGTRPAQATTDPNAAFTSSTSRLKPHPPPSHPTSHTTLTEQQMLRVFTETLSAALVLHAIRNKTHQNLVAPPPSYQQATRTPRSSVFTGPPSQLPVSASYWTTPRGPAGASGHYLFSYGPSRYGLQSQSGPSQWRDYFV